MPFIAWIIILVATSENFLPFIIGYMRAPHGAIFLGTVHHPGDYFYYLSQFAQGTYGWLTTQNLYTAEKILPSYIGWSNILVGRVLSLFGLSPILSYQCAIVIATLALFVAAYMLAHTILGNKWKATIALYLFALYHAFPVTRDGAPSYGDYFNNFAVPRVRFGAAPHQLILSAASILITRYTILWCQDKKYRTLWHALALVILNIALASLQPILWGLLHITLAITAITKVLMDKDKIHIMSIYGTPIIFGVIAGLLPFFYLSHLFTTPPFIQLKLWEATQYTQFTLEHFIRSTGPIFLVAAFSIPWLATTRAYSKLFLIVFSVSSYLLFLSPLPRTLGVSHVRFMSTLVILVLSIMTTDGIWQTVFHWKKRLSQQARAMLFSIILVGLTIILLPNHLITIRLSSNFTPSNSYQYISQKDYKLLLYAQTKSTPDDTFLIVWPYNVIFPGLTGRKSYHGHALLTINSVQKDHDAVQFFDNKMTEQEMGIFINNNHITRIIAYSWTVLPKGLIMNPVTQGILTFYEVNPEYLKPYSK